MKLARLDLISVSEVRTTTKVGREFPRDPRAHKKEINLYLIQHWEMMMIVKMIPFVFLKLRIGLTRLHSTYLIIFVICFPQFKTEPNFFATKMYNFTTQIHNLRLQSDLFERYYSVIVPL